MPVQGNRVQMKFGGKDSYSALTTKDPNTMYLVQDSSGINRMYVGDALYGRSVVIVDFTASSNAGEVSYTTTANYSDIEAIARDNDDCVVFARCDQKTVGLIEPFLIPITYDRGVSVLAPRPRVIGKGLFGSAVYKKSSSDTNLQIIHFSWTSSSISVYTDTLSTSEELRIVEITYDETEDTYLSDHTYTEITDLINAGTDVVFRYGHQLTSYINDNGLIGFAFATLNISTNELEYRMFKFPGGDNPVLRGQVNLPLEQPLVDQTTDGLMRASDKVIFDSDYSSEDGVQLTGTPDLNSLKTPGVYWKNASEQSLDHEFVGGPQTQFSAAYIRIKVVQWGYYSSEVCQIMKIFGDQYAAYREYVRHTTSDGASWGSWIDIGTADYLRNDSTMIAVSEGVHICGNEVGTSTHYSECSTSATTAAKSCTLISSGGFTLDTGSRVIVKFLHGHTGSSMTLSINGSQAKAAEYRGSNISSNMISAGDVVEFIYDGTVWNATYVSKCASYVSDGLMPRVYYNRVHDYIQPRNDGYITGGDDLDDWDSGGIYWGKTDADLANMPSPAYDVSNVLFKLTIELDDQDNFYHQIFETSLDGTSYRRWDRYFSTTNETWSSWVEFGSASGSSITISRW